jgi:hypothetical protein
VVVEAVPLTVVSTVAGLVDHAYNTASLNVVVAAPRESPSPRQTASSVVVLELTTATELLALPEKPPWSVVPEELPDFTEYLASEFSWFVVLSVEPLCNAVVPKICEFDDPELITVVLLLDASPL